MFRLGNVDGRSVLVDGPYWYELAHVSANRISSDPALALAASSELHDIDLSRFTPSGDVAATRFGPPSPRPRSVFGLALNYAEHAHESETEAPPAPVVFTKFPSCLVGPTDDIALGGDRVDWEVELVAIIGKAGRHIRREDAWRHVAALTGGQDISDRDVQMVGALPQFCLGKSFDTYGPTGPVAVSTDCFSDPDDVALSCSVNDEVVQDGRTRDLIFSVPDLVAHISSICTLAPGDLIFTGTPAGVGVSRGRFLQPGDRLASHFEEIGTMLNVCR